ATRAARGPQRGSLNRERCSSRCTVAPPRSLIGEADAREARLAARPQEHDQALSLALEPPARQLDIDHLLMIGLAAQADRSQLMEAVTPERIFGECELDGAARGQRSATSTA